MNLHPIQFLLVLVFASYILGVIGFMVWQLITARPYRFTPRPPEPPDGRSGSS